MPGRLPLVQRSSYRAKGQVLDAWLCDALPGQPFRHVLGFAAGEEYRAQRDTSYATACREPDYPLIVWGWDRQACADYLLARFGVAWSRSCCGYCLIWNLAPVACLSHDRGHLGAFSAGRRA